MIEGKSVLAVIPARGGSKGIARKNIREVFGKPLIAYTIEEAGKSLYIDRLVVSTDDPEIALISKQWECDVPFLRPRELALDDTPGIAPVLHLLENLPEKYDIVVLLQPTSPLRSVKDIDECIKYLIQCNAPSCVTLVEPTKSPYWMYVVDDKGQLLPLLNGHWDRRQDLPPAYVLNGAVYVANVDNILQTKSFISEGTLSYIMPRERSIDIDNEMDLKYFEIMLQRKVACDD